MGCVKGSPVTQSWVLWEEFLAVQGFALQCGATISALQRAGAVGISLTFSLQVCLEVLLSPPKQADKSLFVINCMFGHVINISTLQRNLTSRGPRRNVRRQLPSKQCPSYTR